MAPRRTIAADHRRRRLGGVLFEIVLAMALFAGAASFTLGAIRSAFNTLDQTRRKQEAVDLARSKLAELEAGLITQADLRGVGIIDQSTDSVAGQGRPRTADPHGWLYDLKVHRTEFVGLSLVELTLVEDVGSARSDDANGLRYTLRQLMPLRPMDADAYEDDPMMGGMRGLQ